MFKNEAARKIEEHIALLVDYDVLDARVADTLTEYVWKIIGEVDEVVNVDKDEEQAISLAGWEWILKNYNNQNENEDGENNGNL
jgi:hypothetical protein